MTDDADGGAAVGAAGRPRDPRALGVALALFVVGFGLRLVASALFAGEPVWDGHYYDFGARRIAEGHGYSDDRIVDGHAVWHPWCHYPVGYSGYLAIFYRLFGATHASAHVANALVGGLSAVVVYLLARESLSVWRARAAGALVALHPGLVLYGALTMSEPLSGLLVMGAFLAAIVVARRAGGSLFGVAGPIAGGLVLGLAALVRPQALSCAPFLALAALRPSITPRRAARAGRLLVSGVVACAAALVPVLPWTARNCRVMDGCALVSTNAGWNLAIGSFPRATGRFEGLHASDGCRDVTGQVQQDRCWLAYGKAQIRSAPGRWLGLVPRKLAFTFDHESFAVEYLHEARPDAFPEPRRTAWREGLTTLHRGLMVLAAFAFVARGFVRRTHGWRTQAGLAVGVALLAIFGLAQDAPAVWPLALVVSALPWIPLPGRPAWSPGLAMSAGLVATTALAHAVFFGEDRYHVAVTPALCLLAVAAFRRSAERRENMRDANAA